MQPVPGWESPAGSVPSELRRLVYEAPSLVVEVADARYASPGRHEALIENVGATRWPIVQFEEVGGSACSTRLTCSSSGRAATR